MSDKAKRPYVKPTVLFISADSPEYRELIEKLEDSSVPERKATTASEDPNIQQLLYLADLPQVDTIYRVFNLDNHYIQCYTDSVIDYCAFPLWV